MDHVLDHRHVGAVRPLGDNPLFFVHDSDDDHRVLVRFVIDRLSEIEQLLSHLVQYGTLVRLVGS